MASVPTPPRRRSRLALRVLPLAALSLTAADMRAQYPVNPSAAVSMGSLTREPRLSGYISLRETIRDDTSTFIVNRARIGVQALPAPFVAVRVQADLSAFGRISGDTAPAVLVTDAFVQLAPTDSASRIVQLFRPGLIIGQFRTPFSLEALTSFSQVLTVNRSLGADRLSPRRDRGFAGFVRLPRYAMLSAAIVDGEGTNRVTNPDGRQMALGRLTLLPVPVLSVSGKWAGQGSDHRWGYDARLVTGNAVVEGEVIERDGPTNATTKTDAESRYVLAAYRVLPWLQPVVKWERLDETLTTATTSSIGRITLTTLGVNFIAPDDRFRAQLNWIARDERPVDRKGELVAQFQAMF